MNSAFNVNKISKEGCNVDILAKKYNTSRLDFFENKKDLEKPLGVLNCMNNVFYIPRKIGIKMILFYQKHISRYLGKRCIYYPTCSEYTRQAIEKYGLIRGSYKGFFRILRCNPFAKGGIDYLK